MIRTPLLAATALTTSLTALVPVAQGQEIFDWSGFYVGGTMGIVIQRDTATATYPDTVPAGANGYTFFGNGLYLDGVLEDTGLPTAFALDVQGANVGVTAGFNMQSGTFVYGLEGDVGVLKVADSTMSATSAGGNTTVTVTSSLDTLASLRVRGGVTVDRLLLFATAGIAGGNSTLSTSFDYADNSKAAQGDGSGTGLVGGVIAGVGAEYAANDNVSFKVETLYYTLKGRSVTATGSGTNFFGGAETLSPYTVTNNPAGVIVRGGVNFRF